MTRGHVILCLLYIKMHRMSRNILEPESNRFGYANVPSPRAFRFTFLPQGPVKKILGCKNPFALSCEPVEQPKGEDNSPLQPVKTIRVCFFRHTIMVFQGRFRPGFPLHRRAIEWSGEAEPEENCE
jgi:hypothetical protein